VPNGTLTHGAAPVSVLEHEPPARGERFATFASLRHRDYRYLWIGTVFMSAGQWIQQVTLGWLVYDLTNSPGLLGVLQGVRALPFLLFSPISGVAADRFDRRTLLMLFQVILSVTAFLMGILVGSGLVEVWHVFVFALITATAWAFNQPLRQTLVAATVPKENLMNAVALSSVGFNITKVLGPAVGGWLIAAFGAHGNFFVQSAAYALVLISIFQIRVPRNSTEEARGSSAWANLREGFSYVRNTPVVLALLVAALVPSVVAMPYQVLMPVFQRDVYHMGPEVLGFMLAAPGIGAVCSTFALATFAHRIRRKGMILLGAMAMMGVSIAVFSRMDSLTPALFALIAVGACQILYNATNMTVVQLVVPDELRGRVMSIYMMDFGLSPIGGLAAGFGTQFFGAPNTVVVMGSLVVLLAIVIGIAMPQLRQVET
jgi:predicted MFS family arabinose efflux permease